MVDRYSRVVLTIIALALTAIAIEQAIPRAIAYGDTCGSINDPCWIANSKDHTLWVQGPN